MAVPKKIPQHYLDELLRKVDIVSVVSQRIDITKSSDAYLAHCPFHDDSDLSLSVNPASNTYSCSHCSINGSPIGFVMYFDKMLFLESVRSLSESAGMTIDSVLTDGGVKDELQAEKTLLTDSAAYFHEQAREGPGEVYFSNRNIEPAIRRMFSLGYTPYGTKAIVNEYQDCDDLLVSSGICRKTASGKLISRFQNRVVFPVADSDGQVVGFGARAIDDTEPKYLNSPASALFDKSSLLYGWDLRDIQAQIVDTLLVEGYLDVIACHQIGLTMAVSPLGTAVTPEQLSQITHQSNSLCLCFDADTAGRQASLRTIELILRQVGKDITVTVVSLPNRLDPDSYINSFNGSSVARQAFTDLIKDATDMVDFYINTKYDGIDEMSIGAKSDVFSSIQPVIADTENHSLKGLLIRRLSDRLGIDISVHFCD